MRKFYDLDIGGSMSGYVVNEENISNTIIIDCECGSHMMKVTSDMDIFTNSDGTKQYRHDIYLAMYSYGSGKRSVWGRLVIAWKYLRTGKMFSDQLCLTPEEATKLSTFLNDNLTPTP